MTKFEDGNRVEGWMGRFGTVARPDGGDFVNRVYIRWDGNLSSIGYPLDGRVAKSLKVHESANTTTVAQAISRVIDEVQEVGLYGDDYRTGLFLNDDQESESNLRVTEVSAELQNATNGRSSTFQVTTSDGQVWDVVIQPSVKG